MTRPTIIFAYIPFMLPEILFTLPFIYVCLVRGAAVVCQHLEPKNMEG